MAAVRNGTRSVVVLAVASLGTAAIVFVLVAEDLSTPVNGLAAAPQTDEQAFERGDLVVRVEVLPSGEARVYERLEGETTGPLRVDLPRDVVSPLVTEPVRPEVVDPRFTLGGRP